ncbi:hypothetical protein BST16_23790 [Mycobacterium asiaticum DSM 44297]|uniref:Uncharacterized protein n=2 Tax=Mycobacterium asiaticum TaxID=1790 RepID=A0A1A3IU98_MYCAS|nr:hypothetical protein [Mycobacterium asiaticum]OBI85817.1 hypothetical protein A5661_11805 [Mycobacterium asiaticum]OBJ64232.1 hypothetical protein A9W94_10270 [Mycobacterium asiaticum]OBJ84471.1 hypothetical protein A5640_15600 [Mycobacterium asiaticum]ORA09846.1 hypothetical protein BST16_23790 [Mycobacterium asiaticum DSM 44297]
MTVIANALVPLASVISSATVAVWTKRIDARNKAEDRRHERVLDFEKRAADDKKAVLKSLISATMYVKRAAQYEGRGTAAEIATQRRAEAIRELYDFRMRLGLDDGVAELLVYAAPPVQELVGLLLDEWDRQFREHGYSLTQLDACKRQLAQSAACPAPAEDATVYYEGELKWSELRRQETVFLDMLGKDSDLDLDALVDLCDRVLAAAHTDLRGGYGLDF